MYIGTYSVQSGVADQERDARNRTAGPEFELGLGRPHEGRLEKAKKEVSTESIRRHTPVHTYGAYGVCTYNSVLRTSEQ